MKTEELPIGYFLDDIPAEDLSWFCLKSWARGLVSGRESGLTEGETRAFSKVANIMLEKGVSMPTISIYTGLSLPEIEHLAAMIASEKAEALAEIEIPSEESDEKR